MLDSSVKTEDMNYIFASLFTGVYDVNRNETLKANDFEIIQKWYESVLKLNVNAIIFHNTFTHDIVEKYSTKKISFIEVDYDRQYKPNVFRYFVYRHYLGKCSEEIKHLFVTDSTDVVVCTDPFTSSYYASNQAALFCGDEPQILDNEWMRNHCSQLRNRLAEYKDFENLHRNDTLLNCGIIGGDIATMKLLFDKMCALHSGVSIDNATPYTLDMGVFNYVARTEFAKQIIHGEPINTVFKKYEVQRSDCWFRHK